MVVDIDTLIVEIRNRPPLYDTSNKEYHDRRLKKQLWGEVCCSLRSAEIWESMNSKHKMKYEKEVLTKWNSLRTCFRRELRANQYQSDGIPEKKKRKYIYFDDLLFLLPFTKVINNESSFENDQASDLSDISEEGIIENKKIMSPSEKATSETYQEPMIPLATLIKTETTSESERNSVTLEFSDEESPVNDTRNDFNNTYSQINKSTNRNDDEHRQVVRERFPGNSSKSRLPKLSDVDDDEAFLSSLLPSLKEFSTEEKLRLRIELLRTILNFKKSTNSGSNTKVN